MGNLDTTAARARWRPLISVTKGNGKAKKTYLSKKKILRDSIVIAMIQTKHGHKYVRTSPVTARDLSTHPPAQVGDPNNWAPGCQPRGFRLILHSASFALSHTIDFISILGGTRSGNAGDLIAVTRVPGKKERCVHAHIYLAWC
jgi:hypothetical protein